MRKPGLLTVQLSPLPPVRVTPLLSLSLSRKQLAAVKPARLLQKSPQWPRQTQTQQQQQPAAVKAGTRRSIGIFSS